MVPRDELSAILVDLASATGVEVNVYAAPPALLAVPALVIRPDSPWRNIGTFTRAAERYAVVAVVQAGGDPGSLVDTLRELVVLVENAQDVGKAWQWTETTGIIQAAESGIDYLAATVRLTYLEG
jgi:hypothetical protein